MGKHRKKPEPEPEKGKPDPGPPIKFTCLVCGRSYKEINDAVNCKHR